MEKSKKGDFLFRVKIICTSKERNPNYVILRLLFSLNAVPSTGEHRFCAFRSPRFTRLFSSRWRINYPFLPTDIFSVSSFHCIVFTIEKRLSVIYEREERMRVSRTQMRRRVFRTINRYQALKSPAIDRTRDVE